MILMFGIMVAVEDCQCRAVSHFLYFPNNNFSPLSLFHIND